MKDITSTNLMAIIKKHKNIEKQLSDQEFFRNI